MSGVTPSHDPHEPEIALPTYHRELLDYLRLDHTELWNWFDSNPVRTQPFDAVRLSLLRSACRIDRTVDTRLYELADRVKDVLDVSAAVTFYQAQNSQSRNVSLSWLPGEAHVVLHGDVQDLLSDAELRSVIAHELAHHELYTLDGSAFLTVEQVLNAMLADRSASPSHTVTWRTFRLYTELYCDRRSLEVDGLQDVVAALVKIDTGLRDVSADAYLKQAEEILAAEPRESDGDTHPEMYIRAHALAAWRRDRSAADDVVRPLIEGPLNLSRLDLLQQSRLSQLTERFLCDFLRPAWLQTRVTCGHMRRFFPDFTWTDSPVVPADEQDLTIAAARCDPQIERYLCCLLLDFVTADPQLEDAPLAAAFLFADQHDLGDVFEQTAEKELRLGKRHFQRIRREAAEITEAAEREFAE